MSADGSVELVFGGDLRRFRLGIAELLALQESRKSGPMEIAARLQFGNWLIQDLAEVLRIGLIGGGDQSTASAEAARDLIKATVAPPNIVVHVLAAQAVLLSSIQGVPDDPVGKAPAAAATAAGSPRPTTTGKARKPASRRNKSGR